MDSAHPGGIRVRLRKERGRSAYFVTGRTRSLFHYFFTFHLHYMLLPPSFRYSRPHHCSLWTSAVLKLRLNKTPSPAMRRLISTLAFLALCSWMSTLPVVTSAVSTSAGHGCWIFDASECNTFCKEYFEKPGHCGGFFYQTCYCD